MKLYDGGRAPNPRRIRIFLAEKGIEVPLVPIDMTAREHKTPEFTALNPFQRLPALELDEYRFGRHASTSILSSHAYMTLPRWSERSDMVPPPSSAPVRTKFSARMPGSS